MYAKQSKDRRVKYQDKQRELGNCIVCAQPKGDSPYKSYCRFHGGLRRLYQQKRLKQQQWRKGRGRAPQDIPVKDRYELEHMLGKQKYWGTI